VDAQYRLGLIFEYGSGEAQKDFKDYMSAN